MQVEHVICSVCGSDVRFTKLKSGGRGWYCVKCKKVVIGKSILKEVQNG